MLQPARRKYRKEQKGRNTGVATRGAAVSFGDFGLKATERGRLTARQIEAARRAISRHIKRGGRPGGGGFDRGAPRQDAARPAEAAAPAGDAPKTPAVKRVRKAPTPGATDVKAEPKGE